MKPQPEPQNPLLPVLGRSTLFRPLQRPSRVTSSTDVVTLELRRGQAWLPVLMASRARGERLPLSELVAVIFREGTFPQVRIFVTSGHSFRPGGYHQHNRQHGERQRHEGAMPALARSRGSRHRASRSTCSRRKRSRSSKACERRNEASGAARAQRAPVRSLSGPFNRLPT